MKLDFNQEWRVYPTPEPEEWNRPRTYEIVNLPHDYNISLETQKERSTGPAGGYYPGCSVEYEKDLCIPDEWKNKLFFLEFDGVYHNAVLWINGKFAARHPNGYTPFWREITEFVKPGENHIRVSAANEDIPNSRWYTGTGIYRDVHLWVKNPLYIPLRGVILTAKAAEGQAEVNCRVTVANKTEEPVQAVLKVRLTDPDGNRSETSGNFHTGPKVSKCGAQGSRQPAEAVVR
ncbi:MAG: sugar-binding domain-containing protein [[Clostridium] leptum]